MTGETRRLEQVRMDVCLQLSLERELWRQVFYSFICEQSTVAHAVKQIAISC
jgi:hypothetical protein